MSSASSSSTSQHAAKIAVRLADAIRARGLEIDRRDVSRPDNGEPARYHVTVVAGSLREGRHHEEIFRWFTAHLEGLGGCPTVFLLVSLSAAGHRGVSGHDAALDR